MIKAIILAAGKGERLKGTVEGVPKPMVKVGDRSILEHNLRWLGRHGVEEVYINVHHLANVIRDCLGRGDRWGMRINYSYEPKLLGTAGAVRKIAEDYWMDKTADSEDGGSYFGVREPFLVIYGDNLLSDFDIDEIVAMHRRRGGIASICLYRRDNVSQSGIAVLDGDDRIVRFIEKPSADDIVSHLVNTGIYMLEPRFLEYIPADCFCDFGRDVFGRVISAGEDIYGIVSHSRLIAIDTPELLEKALAGRTEQ